MSKINVKALKMPERPRVTRTFTDRDHPGVELTLTLRRLMTAELLTVIDAADGHWESFADHDVALGDDITFHYGNKPDAPEGQTYGGLTFIRQVFTVCAMQCPDDPADAYTEHEMLGIFVKMPLTAAAIMAWANEVQGHTELPRDEAGN